MSNLNNPESSSNDEHTNKPDKPILVYDGNCPFCRFWVNKWKALVHDEVSFLPFQKLPYHYFGINRHQFKKSVYLLTPYRRLKGAEAVFELLAIAGDNTWIYLYHNMPMANKLFELGYRLIASNRDFFYTLTKLIYPDAKKA